MAMTERMLNSRRERRKEETRQKLFDAALALMKEKPFDQITVEEITERADVAKGTFFSHFPTKEHLLIAYTQEMVEDVYAFLEQLQPEKASSQWEVMRQVMRFIAEIDGHSIERTRSMMVACCNSPLLREMMTQMMDEATQRALIGFQRGQQTGEFRIDVSAEQLAYYATRLYRICLMEWMMERPDDNLTEIVEQTLEFFKPAFVKQEEQK